MADAWSSQRLIYRALSPHDDDFLNMMASDPTSFLNTVPQLPVPQSREQASRYREYITRNSLITVMICIAPSAATERPTPIGTLSLGGVRPGLEHHRHAMLTIFIVTQYHGQGYGTEAIEWMLRWGFQRANLHRMEIGACEWNTGALRLYERMGFTVEGRKRDHYWFNGRYWDDIGMGMLESE